MNIGLFRRFNRFARYFPHSVKCRIYRKLGMKIGEGSCIGVGVWLDNPATITIGKNCYINMNSSIYTGNGQTTVTFEDEVNVGMECKFVCITHVIGPSSCRCGERIYKPITVGKGSWLGANVTVLPGVHIGEGCMIAAGSVVAKDCEPNWMYGGVPAKKIKYLGEE